MQRTQMLSTAVAFLMVAAGAVDAQGRGRGRGREGQAPGEVANDERQRRILEEQRRVADYRHHLDEQLRSHQQQEAALRAQRRMAQYRAQQEYYVQLARQQQQLRAERDFAREAYVTAPHIYRYHVAGVYRETNQFGVNVLHDAVNDG
jgi:Rad3-related DNA helicase